jgi:hypothetical protein
MPGAMGTICTVVGADAVPFTLTTTLTVPEAAPVGNNPNGNCALTCEGVPGIMLNIGAGRLLTVTETPPSKFGSGVSLADAMTGARFAPKIETSEPGATASPSPNRFFAKLAPLRMAPLITLGVGMGEITVAVTVPIAPVFKKGKAIAT